MRRRVLNKLELLHLIFPFHFSEQFGEHRSMIRQISKQKAKPVSHKNSAHESEQDVVVTGNHTVTQHH